MMPQERVWKIAFVVGVLLTVFLAVLSIKEIKSIAYVGRDTPIMNSITVNGKGEAVSIPDIATFSFTVTEQAAKVADAQTKATAKTNAAIKAMKDGGVDEKDIKTLSYTINPHYEYTNSVCPVYSSSCTPSKSTLTGYEVSQTIEIKVRDLEKAGALLSTAGTLGVQNVNGLNFSVDNIEAVKAKAREQAINDAQAKAKVLSAQLGVRLVRIMSYYDSSNEPMYYGRGGDMMSEKVSIAPMAANPDVPAGEQKTTSNVTITYEIR